MVMLKELLEGDFVNICIGISIDLPEDTEPIRSPGIPQMYDHYYLS